MPRKHESTYIPSRPDFAEATVQRSRRTMRYAPSSRRSFLFVGPLVSSVTNRVRVVSDQTVIAGVLEESDMRLRKKLDSRFCDVKTPATDLSLIRIYLDNERALKRYIIDCINI